MAGYRGDGYGLHGQYGDDDYYDEIRETRQEMREDRDRNRDDDRWRSQSYDRDRGRGRSMYDPDSRHDEGRAAYPTRWAREDDDDHEPGFFDRVANKGHYYLTGDERTNWDDDYSRTLQSFAAADTADNYRRRYGMAGHEGQYGQDSRNDRYTQGDRYGEESRYGQSGSSRNWQPQDQHYLSWRDRQLEDLDRDYHDYSQERGQQFHQEFETWRQNRSAGQSGMSQSLGSTGTQGMSSGTQNLGSSTQGAGGSTQGSMGGGTQGADVVGESPDLHTSGSGTSATGSTSATAAGSTATSGRSTKSRS